MTTKYDVISVENIEAFSKSGVFEAEKILGQTFIIDVYLYISPQNMDDKHHDDIENTIDYAVVSREVRDFAKNNPVNLIEAMAHDLARMLLNKFELCQGLKITVTKPYIPVENFSGNVSVTIERIR